MSHIVQTLNQHNPSSTCTAIVIIYVSQIDKIAFLKKAYDSISIMLYGNENKLAKIKQ